MADFDELIDRSSSLSKRWQGRGSRISLTIGDSDFRMPGEIKDALAARLDEGVVGYDNVPEDLEKLIVLRLEKRYGWKIEPDWLVFLPGVVPGLNFACREFVADDEFILTETPIYYPFLEAPGNSKRAMLELPAIQGHERWDFDLERFEFLVSQNPVPLFLFCNPQNPLGRVSTVAELAAMSDICLKHNVLICSDEIHCDLVYGDRQHIPVASISKEVANATITLMSPSKAFGISGIGGAFAVIPDAAVRARFEAAAGGVNMGMTALPIVAMQAAYGECDDWFAEMMVYLTENRDFVFKALAGIPGLQMFNPEGTYFIWIDFSNTGLNNPFDTLLDAGVELSDGEVFGNGQCLRLNFASPRARLGEALDRIAAKLSG